TSHCRSGVSARRGSGTDRADTTLPCRKAARFARRNRQGPPLARCRTGKRVQRRRFNPAKEPADGGGQARAVAPNSHGVVYRVVIEAPAVARVADGRQDMEEKFACRDGQYQQGGESFVAPPAKTVTFVQ